MLLFTCGMLATQSKETVMALIKSITTQLNGIDAFAVALERVQNAKKNKMIFT